jgi:hypothetical protein
MFTLLLFMAAEAAAEGAPWWAFGAIASLAGVVAILWKTSEGRTAQLLALQERTLVALAQNTAALESLRDALNEKPQ